MHSIKFNGKGRYARLLITSVFLLASVQSAFAQNADFCFQRSLKRVKAGDRKGAIADLSMVIKLDTKSQGAFSLPAIVSRKIHACVAKLK